MRIRTVLGTAVVGAAAVGAVAAGGIAAAADDEPVVRIVTEEPAAENAVQPGEAPDRENCPEKGGATDAPGTGL